MLAIVTEGKSIFFIFHQDFIADIQIKQIIKKVLKNSVILGF
jgi:hypothetical protein